MAGQPGKRRWWSGVAAGVILATAACASVASGLVAGVPLFDGLAPPPLYRWVVPPAVLRAENRAPSSASGTVSLEAGGSPSQDVATEDGQVDVQLPEGAFGPAPGQSAVRISVAPVDPAAAPALPPGESFQGNVYRIGATYVPSGETATVLSPFRVELRFPVDATKVVYNPGNGWQVLGTIPEPSALALIGSGATGPGLFAAVLIGVPPAKPAQVPAWVFLAVGVALVLVAVPTVVGRRRVRAATSPPAPVPDRAQERGGEFPAPPPGDGDGDGEGGP